MAIEIKQRTFHSAVEFDWKIEDFDVNQTYSASVELPEGLRLFLELRQISHVGRNIACRAFSDPLYYEVSGGVCRASPEPLYYEVSGGSYEDWGSDDDNYNEDCIVPFYRFENPMQSAVKVDVRFRHVYLGRFYASGFISPNNDFKKASQRRMAFYLSESRYYLVNGTFTLSTSVTTEKRIPETVAVDSSIAAAVPRETSPTAVTSSYTVSKQYEFIQSRETEEDNWDD